jgi:RNA polymerase sigma factor (TIGR02999 family)
VNDGSRTGTVLNAAPPDDVTRLLSRWSGGDDRALEALLPLLYDDLRRLARGCLSRERAGRTLQTHDLVHEAFLRLIDQRRVDWRSRAHFLAIASRMMRRILIDQARKRASGKRGAQRRRLDLDDLCDVPEPMDAEILAVDEALTELEEIDEELARIVELRFFGGLDHEEIAIALGISVATVGRRFRIAKAWLYRSLCGKEIVHGG